MSKTDSINRSSDKQCISITAHWRQAFSKHLTKVSRPISTEKRALLQEKWNSLPQELQVKNQVLGQHWIACGYTMGPAYCSFGCSHCYLPKSANRLPLVTFDEMKQQIIAQRALLGPGGNLQITGGDVVDAYWREGRKEELIAVLKFAEKNDLVPMLMTHGQVLLENPEYLDLLVLDGGLRKLSIHIDTTMAGRKGYPIKTLHHEEQLNPLRDQFVELILQCRKRTGKLVVAAQTVTVTEKNIHSIRDILKWLMSNSCNMDVCRTISFQPEAIVGRTKINDEVISPEAVWSCISDAVNRELKRDHLLFGHPDCSSVATILSRPHDNHTVYLESSSLAGEKFWASLLHTFGGIEARSTSPLKALKQKIFAIVRRPEIIVNTARYAWQLLMNRQLSLGFIWSLLIGNARGFNIVMHNFLSEESVQHPRSTITQQRLDACAFKGVIKMDGKWQAISMCEMNTDIRPQIYNASK